MTIINSITNNGIASASFNGKNYTRREVNGVVFYDISGGGASSSGGGANVTTDPNAPTGGSDGDLWYDETNGSLYVYTDSINGWIQTNGGGGTAGGASVTTGDTAPTNPADGDLWFDESVSELYAYIESQTAWIQTNGGSSGSGGSGGSPRAYGFYDAGSIAIVDSYNIASWTRTGSPSNTLDINFSNTITDIRGVLFTSTGDTDSTRYEIVSGNRIRFILGLLTGGSDDDSIYFQVF